MAGATIEAPPEPPALIMPAMSFWPDPTLERFRHRGDRSAAIAAEHRRAAAAVIERDFLRRHVAGCRLPAGRNIDEPRAQAAPQNEVAHEAQLRPLGVQGASDDHHPRPGDQRRGARRRRGSILAGATEAIRALASMRPLGAGCDHRVGATDLRHNPDRRGGRLRRGRGMGRRFLRGLPCPVQLLGMAADAEEPLLELAIVGEPARFDNAVDPSVDHDRDVFGDRGRDADILLDDEDRHVGFLAETQQHLLDLRDNDRREPFGRLIHDEKARIGDQRRDIASICCSPPESWPPLLVFRSARRGKVS